MSGFDIDGLIDFRPPQHLCEHCYALLSDFRGVCPVCGVRYLLNEEVGSYRDYFRARGLGIDFNDLVGHSQRLARIARQVRAALATPDSGYPPLRGLLSAISSAEHFIHFTSYGISSLLIGALKMAAQRIVVRGLIAGVKHDNVLRELTDHQYDAPGMHIRIFPNAGSFFPHQKILVIDGLLAFKGSANMTDFAWRRAAQGHEMIESVTTSGDVIEVNNRFFSPTWLNWQQASGTAG